MVLLTLELVVVIVIVHRPVNVNTRPTVMNLRRAEKTNATVARRMAPLEEMLVPGSYRTADGRVDVGSAPQGPHNGFSAAQDPKTIGC